MTGVQTCALPISYDGKLLTEDGFACMVELLIKLRRVTSKISEVPMILKADLRVGHSKMKKFDTIIAYLRIILKNGIFQRFKNLFRNQYS